MANSVWIGWLGTSSVTTSGTNISLPGQVQARTFAANGAPALTGLSGVNATLYVSGGAMLVESYNYTSAAYAPFTVSGGGGNCTINVRTADSLVLSTANTTRWAVSGAGHLLAAGALNITTTGNVTAGQVLTNTAASVIQSGVALTNGAGASVGTLTNAPAAGNPTKWIGINDNGTVRYVPAW